MEVNGKATKAKLESGSAISYIRPAGARELGVDPGGPNAKPAADVMNLAPNPIPTWIGHFDSFQIGGEKIENARLLIGQLSSPNTWEYSGDPIPQKIPTASVYLGADFFRAHHLIVVPEKQVALFTYNGGEVFLTDRPK